MKKIVVNKCFGGFSISKECAEYMAELGDKQAIAELKERKGDKERWFGYGYSKKFNDEYKRDSETLVQAVEKLGSEKASGEVAKLEVIEIPKGVDWYIHDYDGLEEIHENHRSW